jgi:hypothetical protein
LRFFRIETVLLRARLFRLKRFFYLKWFVRVLLGLQESNTRQSVQEVSEGAAIYIDFEVRSASSAFFRVEVVLPR